MFQVIQIERGRLSIWRACDTMRDAIRERDWLAYLGGRAIIYCNR